MQATVLLSAERHVCGTSVRQLTGARRLHVND